MARILLIEPDTVLSNIYGDALNRAGHSVQAVFDAQSAINIVDKFKPELVILELQLPIHNGIEFLYEFRSYIEWQNTPVIILSFVPSTEFQPNNKIWQGLGVVNYLYKPQLSLRQLLNTVQDHVALLSI